jgi:hypothetical protein
VRYAVPADGVPEGPHDVILADDVVERLGPPLAREDLVGGRHGK